MMCPKFLCLSENWLKHCDTNEKLAIPGYALFRTDRPNNSGIGDVAAYVKEDIDVNFKRFSEVEGVEALSLSSENLYKYNRSMLGKSLWSRFKVFQLDEIMRQKEDLSFAQMLNEICCKPQHVALSDGAKELLSTGFSNMPVLQTSFTSM